MKQIELYVPLEFNDGTPVPLSRFEGFEALIRHYFDGFSTYCIDGQWKDDDGVVTADRCKVYRIIIAGEPIQMEGIERLAVSVKHCWKQETVLYTISDVEAAFV